HEVYPDALFGQAQVLYRTGDYENAETFYRQAKEAFETARLARGGPMKDMETPAERDADMGIARSLMKRGVSQYDKAQHQFLQIVRDYQNTDLQRESWISLGDICYEGAQVIGDASEYHEAEHYYNEFITAVDNPASHPSANKLATVYYKLGLVYEGMAESV